MRDPLKNLTASEYDLLTEYLIEALAPVVCMRCSRKIIKATMPKRKSKKKLARGRKK